MKDKNKNGIQDDIDDRADDGGEHAHFGKALGSQKRIHAHDNQYTDTAEYVDPPVSYRVGKCCIGCTEEPQQRGCSDVECHSQDSCQDQQEGKTIAHDVFSLFLFSAAHVDSCPRRTAGAGQQSEGCEQHQNRGEKPDAGESQPADFRDMPDVNSIDYIVEQIDDLSDDGRDSHLHHQLFDAAGAHIRFLT